MARPSRVGVVIFLQPTPIAIAPMSSPTPPFLSHLSPASRLIEDGDFIGSIENDFASATGWSHANVAEQLFGQEKQWRDIFESGRYETGTELSDSAKAWIEIADEKDRKAKLKHPLSHAEEDAKDDSSDPDQMSDDGDPIELTREAPMAATPTPVRRLPPMRHASSPPSSRSRSASRGRRKRRRSNTPREDDDESTDSFGHRIAQLTKRLATDDRVLFLEQRVRGLETEVESMHKALIESEDRSCQRSEIMHAHFMKIMEVFTQQMVGRLGGAARAPVQDSWRNGNMK